MENTMQKTGLRRGLTTAQLKWIALVLMVLDHIHYFFEFTGKIPEWFSMLGRLSAPLFLFCLLEGFQHTRNRKKYFLRIYVIAVGMGLLQYIFICFVRRPDGFVPQNQMLATFSILLVILQGIDWCKQKKWGRGLSAIVLPLIWPFVGMGLIQAVPSAANAVLLLHYTLLPMHSAIIDGGTYFILEGILLYLFRKRRTGPDFGRGIPVPSYARSYGGNADHYDVWLDERFRGNTYVSLQRTKREGE